MKGHFVFSILVFGAYFGFTIGYDHHRIINGSYAVAKQFPHQVFYDVLDLSNLQEPIKWSMRCGGTLISKRIILTAAHCFMQPNIYALKIYFGAVDKSNKSEIGQQQLVVKRSNVVIHNEYDEINSYNDIALIKLPVDIVFDEYIKPAQLPQPDISYNLKKATVSGWGVVEANGTMIKKPQLKYFNIRILSHAECKKLVQDGVFMKIVSSHICIAPSQNTPCKGDSGGPLTVRHKGDVVLLGITSYGTKKCPVDRAAVYTKVASYLNWIHETAGAHNLDV